MLGELKAVGLKTRGVALWMHFYSMIYYDTAFYIFGFLS
jgi:hypothetical protein